jgi:glyoxylase-like metal-dependent hydrolase (beta-lactamase superfamily II)
MMAPRVVNEPEKGAISMRLTSQVFVYPWQGAGNNCNSYCLAGERLVLIDPGHVRNEFGEPCLEHLARAMAADNLRLEEVDLILLTHSHPDHSEAAPAIKERSGARLAMHPAEEGHWLAMYRLLHPGQNGEPKGQPVPDFFLDEGELVLGRSRPITLQVLHTPGHSPGSLTFYWPEAKALFTGDVVFAAGVGRTDFPQGNGEQLKESIKRLAALEVEYLLPGHMQMLRGRQAVNNNFNLIMSTYFMYL